MWHRGLPGANRASTASRLAGGRQVGLWLLVAVLVVAGVVGSQLLTGMQGGSPASPGPAATPTGGFLADGYAELNGEQTPAAPSSPWSLWFGMLVPLLIVVASIYAVLRGLKYVNARIAGTAGAARHLESLDTLPLGQHGALHLVRVGERVLVVGAGSGSLSLLAELEPAEAAGVIREHRERGGEAGAALQPFRDLLAQRVGRTPSPGAAGTPPAPPSSAEGNAGDPPATLVRPPQPPVGDLPLGVEPPFIPPAPSADAPRFGHRPDRR